MPPRASTSSSSSTRRAGAPSSATSLTAIFCSAKYPDCAKSLSKYRINPGNVSIGRKDDDNFRTMVEVAVEYQKPVRIGVNWGSLDQALLTKMMDANSKLAEPLDARDVMMEAMVVSALDNAAAELRPPQGPDHPLG